MTIFRLVSSVVVPCALLSACSAHAPSASGSASASAADTETHARTLRYDFVLSIAEAGATKRTSFSLDVSERAPASVSVGKNVALAANARSDVGIEVDARIVRDGGGPKLETEMTLSFVDGAGKVRKVKNHASALATLGSTVTLFEANEDGAQVRLTATSSGVANVGGGRAPGAKSGHAVDVVATQWRDGVAVKTTPLGLTLTDDAPATARAIETIPLTVGDGGAIATPRQDTGARVKATARSYESGLELDFDFEMSAVEQGSPSTTIRKIVARGPVLAPFETPATAVLAEDDGSTYEVTVTAHR